MTDWGKNLCKLGSKEDFDVKFDDLSVEEIEKRAKSIKTTSSHGFLQYFRANIFLYF